MMDLHSDISLVKERDFGVEERNNFTSTTTFSNRVPKLK